MFSARAALAQEDTAAAAASAPAKRAALLDFTSFMPEEALPAAAPGRGSQCQKFEKQVK
jgi:hypothetical protein